MLPSFLFLLLFTVFPLVYGLGISLFDYNPANSSQAFLGLAQYTRLLQDEVFWKALRTTLLFSLIVVVCNLIITLFLAKIISVLPSKRLRTLFRAILFIPCIAPLVGTSLIWKHGIFGTEGGLLNNLLGLFGIPPTDWFLTTVPLFFLIVLFTLWADIGYNVVLFTAGVEAVPKELREAAAIDGAGPFRQFVQVELPLMRRIFAFVCVMTMASSCQMFAQFRILVPGGGRNSNLMVLTNYVYSKSFTSFDMGYASAVAAALFVLVFGVALVQNAIMRADWSYE